MKKLVVLLSLCSALFGPANASPQVTIRYPVWGSLNGQIGLPRNWFAAADLQLRYEYVSADWLTQAIRAGAGKKLGTFSVVAGFAFFRNFPVPNGKPARPELRPWQELNKKVKSGLSTFSARLRIEERFNRDYAGDVLQDKFSFHSVRGRVRGEWSRPVGINPDNKFLLVAGDEVFLSVKKNGFSAFDQNRAYAGIGYRLNPLLSLQLHYLNLFQQINSKKYELHHVIRISALFELNIVHDKINH